MEMNNWPCGHPRTVENTRLCGAAGVRCKTCRRLIDKKHDAKRRAKAKAEREAAKENGK